MTNFVLSRQQQLLLHPFNSLFKFFPGHHR